MADDGEMVEHEPQDGTAAEPVLERAGATLNATAPDISSPGHRVVGGGDMDAGPWHTAEASAAPQLKGEEIKRESLAARIARGRALRSVMPREIHGAWTPSTNRRSPVDILSDDDIGRQQDLVPLRYGRMSVSPFTFYRGAASIMAADLAGTPTSGIQVQLCGDCHLNNFGLYASPERRLLFDVNDFDETLPGPWEWDLKRLVASFVIGCRSTHFSAAEGREAAMRVCASYRTHMAEFAEMGFLDVWYSHVDADEVFSHLKSKAVKRRVAKGFAKARNKDRLGAFAKLTEIVNGHRQFKSDPPVLVRVTTDDLTDRVRRQMRAYCRTLQPEQRRLLEQYEPVDIARKVVGVGSVGTRCLVVLLEGHNEEDPLFIQVKEAGPSALEGHLPRSRHRNHGQRVVVGQRHMQAASDVFLGWIRGDDSTHYYFRQLQDMKGAFDLEVMRPVGLMLYAEVCGWALARAHARSGDHVQIASYLGRSKKFDRAMADFAEAYADQNERDYETLMRAIRSGKIPTMAG